jgi:hypothetical protein
MHRFTNKIKRVTMKHNEKRKHKKEWLNDEGHRD